MVTNVVVSKEEQMESGSKERLRVRWCGVVIGDGMVKRMRW
jgi:hypothetical protein